LELISRYTRLGSVLDGIPADAYANAIRKYKAGRNKPSESKTGKDDICRSEHIRNS